MGSGDGERMATLEEGITTTYETPSSKIKNFIFKKQPPTPLLIKDRLLKSCELRQWSSNSTIESFCSTSAGGGGVVESSFETPTESIVYDRRSSGGGNRSPRRPSTGSGQWKGVRWKPMLDETAAPAAAAAVTGNIWNENNLRINDTMLLTTTPSCSSTSAASILPPRRIASTQIIANRRSKSQAYQAGCAAYNDLIIHSRTATTAISLPNLLVGCANLSDDYDAETATAAIAAASSSSSSSSLSQDRHCE